MTPNELYFEALSATLLNYIMRALGESVQHHGMPAMVVANRLPPGTAMLVCSPDTYEACMDLSQKAGEVRAEGIMEQTIKAAKAK